MTFSEVQICTPDSKKSASHNPLKPRPCDMDLLPKNIELHFFKSCICNNSQPALRAAMLNGQLLRSQGRMISEKLRFDFSKFCLATFEKWSCNGLNVALQESGAFRKVQDLLKKPPLGESITLMDSPSLSIYAGI